ncbi:MAG: tRNA (adenosine(37)-N6)-dimethylallyltransferase MiaA [Spirochaetales bacterium]|nr:tRNA (adenosine(37)-N6)-dimethylallyltransferase MiaA [Spirochaetales bacterium]
MKKIPIILIFGPTAVGKTELLLSPVFNNSEIINADSMQVYRGMDIGTAKPDKGFLKRVKHHLIDIRNPGEQFHAGEFVQLADSLAEDITSSGKLAVICGGSGFYLRNFIYGLPEAPPSDESVRNELQAKLSAKGAVELYKRLQSVDPVAASRIELNDHYRIVRALEVYKVSGKPLSSFSIPDKPRAKYDIYLIGLQRDRSVLYERINERVDLMFNSGLGEEIDRLKAEGCDAGSPGMRGIGYREFFQAESQGFGPERVVELIKRNSRHYAKRQITYFRQLESINWFQPDDVEGINLGIRHFLER